MIFSFQPNSKKNMNFTDLLAFKKSFSSAMKIFKISKSFPKEEKYSLTNQIRRSFRSVSVENLEVVKLTI
jgi:hypothetical protein